VGNLLGTGTIYRGSDKETGDEDANKDRDLPTIEELLLTKLQEQGVGLTTEDQGPDKTGGIEKVASEERRGFAKHTRLAQSGKASGSLGERAPIYLLS
jgi:hypothetical protein